MAETDLGLNPSSGANNANSLTLQYRGPGALTSITFNPEGRRRRPVALPVGTTAWMRPIPTSVMSIQALSLNR